MDIQFPDLLYYKKKEVKFQGNYKKKKNKKKKENVVALPFSLYCTRSNMTMMAGLLCGTCAIKKKLCLSHQHITMDRY